MNRLTSLLEQLPLSEITRVLRRMVWAAAITAVIALGVAIAVDHVLVGLGACIGLVLGIVNIRLIARSVSRISAQGTSNPSRALGTNTAMRLGMTTVIVIGIAIASTELGLGTAGGIALFYLLLMTNLARTLLQQDTTAAHPNRM